MRWSELRTKDPWVFGWILLVVQHRHLYWYAMVVVVVVVIGGCWWWRWCSKCIYYMQRKKSYPAASSRSEDSPPFKVLPSYLLLFSRHDWYYHKSTISNYILLSVSMSMFTLRLAAVSHCLFNFWCCMNTVREITCSNFNIFTLFILCVVTMQVVHCKI